MVIASPSEVPQPSVDSASMCGSTTSSSVRLVQMPVRISVNGPLHCQIYHAHACPHLIVLAATFVHTLHILAYYALHRSHRAGLWNDDCAVTEWSTSNPTIYRLTRIDAHTASLPNLNHVAMRTRSSCGQQLNKMLDGMHCSISVRATFGVHTYVVGCDMHRVFPIHTRSQQTTTGTPAPSLARPVAGPCASTRPPGCCRVFHRRLLAAIQSV